MKHSALADVDGDGRYHCQDVVEATKGRPQYTDFWLKIEGNNFVLGTNFFINIGGK
jgi:hypothetical protein